MDFFAFINVQNQSAGMSHCGSSKTSAFQILCKHLEQCLGAFKAFLFHLFCDLTCV